MPRSPVCLDASFVVRLVAGTSEERSLLLPLWDRWKGEQRLIVAPSLLRHEAANGLYRYQLHGSRSAVAVALALQAMLDLEVDYHDPDDLHAAAIEWAARFRLPAAYDAHYLALADRLGTELWTADRRLANAVRPALGACRRGMRTRR